MIILNNMCINQSWKHDFLITMISEDERKKSAPASQPQSMKETCEYPPSGGGLKDGGKMPHDALTRSPDIFPDEVKKLKINFGKR